MASRYGLIFFWSWFLVGLLFVAPFFFLFWLFQKGWWGQAIFFSSVTLGLLLLIRTWVMYRRNICFITTHRIVDISYQSFFEQTITDVPYDDIETVYGKVTGFWGSLFRYGSVTIDTTTPGISVVIAQMKHPADIQQEIQTQRKHYCASAARDFGQNLTKGIIEKLYELELEDLRHIQKSVAKRIASLSQHNDDRT